MAWPKFDAYCTVCNLSYLYVAVARNAQEEADWRAKVDRLAVLCPRCDVKALILFEEREDLKNE